MPPEQQITPSNETPVNLIPQPQVSQIAYAGFWIRFLALTLDSFLVSVVFSVPISIVSHGIGSNSTPVSLGTTLLHMVLTYGYFIFFTNRNQATIGKKLLGLRVVSEDGTPLSLGKIAFRETIGRIISVVIFCIGYFMVGFTPKKQGLHDKMVGSIVLSNRATRKMWAVLFGIVLSLAVPLISTIIAVVLYVPLMSVSSFPPPLLETSDEAIKSDLHIVQMSAYLHYNRNQSYALMLTDPMTKRFLEKAELVAHANHSGGVSDIGFAIYLPLEHPTAPYTGWCVDEDGTARESTDPGAATFCP